MVHCTWLLILLTMVFIPKCRVFAKLYKFCGLPIYFLESCTTIKSCTTKEKSCTFLVHCPWLLISFTMVFVAKCTVFSKAVQILWSSYIYFSKAVQQLKSCTTKEKSCTSLVHCPWLLISFTVVFVAKCTVFSKAVQILWSSYIYIYLKRCTTIKKQYTKEKSCTSLVHCPGLLISFTMVFVPKCTVFSKAVQILWSSYVYF